MYTGNHKYDVHPYLSLWLFDIYAFECTFNFPFEIVMVNLTLETILNCELFAMFSLMALFSISFYFV